jgi:hypothetical protein
MTNEEEEVLSKALVTGTSEGFIFHVIRKAPDPIATRISCGGDRRNAYCTYRGDIQLAIDILRNAAAVLMALHAEGTEPEIAPDAGKSFA